MMTEAELAEEARQDQLSWEKIWKKERLHDKRVLLLVKKLTSKKFVEAFQNELGEGGTYPIRIVRLQDIKRRRNFHGHLHRIPHRVHKNKHTQSCFIPWNHTFSWCEGGYLGDDYSGEIFYPLGRGRYLRCWWTS
jgi:hypothetical protein